MGLTGISRSTVPQLGKGKPLPATGPRTPAGDAHIGGPEAPAGRRPALSPAGCGPSEGARGRAHRVRRRHDRPGGQHRRAARDRRPAHRSAHRPVGGRDLPGDRPEGPGPARPEGREAGDLRRASGPHGRDPAGDRRDLAKMQGSLRPQGAGLCAPRPARHGHRRDPAGLPPSRPHEHRRDPAPWRRPAARALAEARRAHGPVTGRSWTGPATTGPATCWPG